jgi:hypothetical protein
VAEYRAWQIGRCESDPAVRAAVLKRCAEDCCYYVNNFVWTYDPKDHPDDPVVPFALWPFQVDLINVWTQKLGRADRHIKKSRQIGASWLIASVVDWFCRNKPYQNFILASRVENLVDRRGDPASLMWKFDFIEDHLPDFLKCADRTRRKLHIGYGRPGNSVINGSSTNQDLARGATPTAIILDEFAAVENGHEILRSTQLATRSRFFISTPKGAGTAFYDLERNSEIERDKVYWWQHPERAEGLYLDEKGRRRSPWYDEQCRRAAHPIEIAQELDLDDLGSDYQFYENEVLDRCQAQDVREPTAVGELEFDRRSLGPVGFVRAQGGDAGQERPMLPGGRLRLWTELVDGKPDPRGVYFMGVDCAAGSGSTNSVACVVEGLSGEKIAEFATPNMEPTSFAEYCVALGRWFGGHDEGGCCHMIWECPGPGLTFGQTVVRAGYGNYYFRTDDHRTQSKPTDSPGFWATPKTKMVLHGEYRRALKDGRFVNRSFWALEECRMYCYTRTGDVEHSGAVRTVDPSGARKNHGDRVVADALACKQMLALPRMKPEDRTVVPKGCFWDRYLESQKRVARLEDGWLKW